MPLDQEENIEYLCNCKTKKVVGARCLSLPCAPVLCHELVFE